MKKRDIIASLICGEIASWFLILILTNPKFEEAATLAALKNVIWYLPIILPIIFLIGIWLASLLGKLIKVIYQFIKFAETGVLNTFIDMGILSLLSGLTGITSGAWLVPLNTVSFFCATTNSYYWNKLWTFQRGKGIVGKEFFQFFIITIIGWGINTGLLVLITTFVIPIVSMSPGAWLLSAKVIATFVSMCWNFLGYKFIVFKK